MTDVQQDAERFIMTTLARRGACTAAEIVDALKASKRPMSWYLFLSTLKTRRLVAHDARGPVLTYRLTKTGKRAYEEGAR